MRHLRLKDLGRWYSGGTPPRDSPEMWEGDVPWISAKDFNNDALSAPTAFISREAAEIHSKLVARDAILVIVRGMALAHGLPVALTEREVAFNQDLRGLVCAPTIHPRFTRYALMGHRLRLNRHIDRAAHGTARLTDWVYSERLPTPDHPAQVQIGDFLDRESDRIATTADELAQLAAGIQAAHIEIMRELVLGEGWQLVPLKRYARTGTGHTPSREHPEYWAPEACTIPWFTLADVNQIRDGRRTVVQDTTDRISEQGVANSSAVKHPVNTVLLSRTASVGFSALMGVEMAVSQDFMTWTCGPQVDPRYLLVALRAMQPELRGLMYGSTHKTIYMPDLHALRVPLPPLPRQREIATIAERRTEELWPPVDELKAMQIALAEYRDALITEAVTGRLDVTRLSEQQLDESAHAVMEGERPEVLTK